MVQTLLSLQFFLMNWHPVVDEQVSIVQGSPSSQTTADVAHCPVPGSQKLFVQRSLSVQTLEANLHPPKGSQVSVVQRLLSLQVQGQESPFPSQTPHRSIKAQKISSDVSIRIVD